MGLCKCPKRKVTNLFCFEHKVNVCENCLVTDHVRCVIKSYLQWLQDSDFETLCCICQDTLEAGEVVRLLCYDVLHVSCAEKFLLAYPAHTAPDGFFCPACHGPFFPPDMVASPVADQLRNTLESMKDLQKRLNGLSAVSHDHPKSSPPIDTRPEPEGKEGRSEAINEPVENGLVIDPERGQSQSPIEKEYSPASVVSVKDDPESDSVSSASDFIATHPGSLSRDAEEGVQSAFSPEPPETSATGDTSIPVNKPSTVAETSMSIPSDNVVEKPKAVESTSFSVSDSSKCDESITTLSCTGTGEAHVVVDVAEDALSTPPRSSPVHIVSVNESFEDQPLDAHSDRCQVETGVSWTLANPHQRSTLFSSSEATPATNSTSTSAAFQGDLSTTLQRHASVSDAKQAYSTPTPNLPFADPHLQYGANARTSSSSSTMMAPRVSQSYSLPLSEDHDDHKYRRKPIMEVVRTWLKIFSPPRGRRSSSSSLWRRFVIILLIAVLSLIGLVLLFHHMGRSGRDDDDPLLDLKANPFVKVDDSPVVNDS